MTGKPLSAEPEAEPEAQPKRTRALPAPKRRVPESQPEREIFARHLRQFRIDAELSQREFAQRIRFQIGGDQREGVVMRRPGWGAGPEISR